MTPEAEARLIELAFRHAPEWKGEREVGRLYWRLYAYYTNEGKIPSRTMCIWNAKMTRLDVIRQDLRFVRRKRVRSRAVASDLISFYFLDHPDIPRDEIEARWPQLHAREPAPDKQCLESWRELRRIILPEFPERERSMLRDYFDHGDRLKDIAGRWDLTESRVHQIIKRALPQLRESLAILNQPCHESHRRLCPPARAG